MQKFRKLPVIVDAVQLTNQNKEMVYHELREIQMNIQPVFRDAKPALLIPTLEGEMVASLGDWIIKGVNGELYPCKPDIFEKTYEPVDDLQL